MRETANPLLQQVLHRRRIRRHIRISIGLWAGFGGLHIVAWWAAFEQQSFQVPQALSAVVWPLLLAATAAFVAVVVNLGRWFLAPGSPEDYAWLETSGAPASGASPTIGSGEPVPAHGSR
jgi:hypothetical protein